MPTADRPPLDAERRANMIALLEEDFLVGGRLPVISDDDRALAAGRQVPCRKRDWCGRGHAHAGRCRTRGADRD